MSLLLALATAGAAIPADHRAAVKEALFDLCPKVVSGELDLASADDAAAIGYRLAQTHPQRTNVETGDGENMIVIWGPVPGDTKTRSCIVTFAAPDMNADFDAIEAAARSHGYVGDPASNVSPVTRQLQLRNEDTALSAFYMIEVGGGADYLDYDRAILVLTY